MDVPVASSVPGGASPRLRSSAQTACAQSPAEKEGEQAAEVTQEQTTKKDRRKASRARGGPGGQGIAGKGREQAEDVVGRGGAHRVTRPSPRPADLSHRANMSPNLLHSSPRRKRCSTWIFETI